MPAGIYSPNIILQTNFLPDTILQTNYPPNMIRGGYFPGRPVKQSGKSNGNVEHKNGKAKAVSLLRIWKSNHSKFKGIPIIRVKTKIKYTDSEFVLGPQ